MVDEREAARADERRRRLAEALRANLRLRKARARAASPQPDPSDDGAEGAGPAADPPRSP
jgi:hypothetical protein